METLEKENGLAILDKREAELIKLKTEFSGLTINGVDDKEGFKKVSEARKTLKSVRVQITKDAKELREGAVKFQRTVIAREEQLIGIIQPIESELHAQEKAIEEEKEKIRIAEEKAEADRIQVRINQLAKFGHAIDFFEAKNISDEAFNELLTQVEIDYNQEQENKAIEAKRLEEEKIERERLRKAEDERIAREKAELANQRAEQERQEKILADEKAAYEQRRRREEEELREKREALEKEKRAHEEKLRLEQEEKDRIANEERIRIETEARIKREAEEKAAKEKAEAERQKALAPDKEKIASFALEVEQITLPEVTSPEAKSVVQSAAELLLEISKNLYSKSQKL